MIVNVILLLLIRFCKNWLLKKKTKLMITKKMQSSLVNEMNLMIDKGSFLLLKQPDIKQLALSIPTMCLLYSLMK